MALSEIIGWDDDERDDPVPPRMHARWSDRLCAHLPYTLLLLESDLKVRLQLGRALPAGLPVKIGSGRLVLPVPIRRRLQSMLSRASDDGSALIKVDQAGSPTVTLILDRVKDAVSGSLWRTVVFPEDGPLPTTDALRRVYRMTPCEAGVVRQLLAGQNLKGAGQHLQISHETARAHLKSAFLKVNVRCQSALVARVMSGPALLLGHAEPAAYSASRWARPSERQTPNHHRPGGGRRPNSD